MYIYKTINLINNKIYIGQSIRTVEESKNYLGSGKPYFNNALKKYGKENFKKEILEICNSQEELNEREQYWIKELNSQDRNVGYNIKDGGLGGKLAEETKEKISNTLKGRKTYREPWNKGKQMSIEFCEKVSLSIKGKSKKKMSEETKQKLREINTGKKATDESKFKMSLKARENITPELRQVRSNNVQGQKNPMYKKSIYDIWILTYGKEKAEEMWKNRYKSKIVKCPWCEKEGENRIMKRWHFNNCKYNPKN